MTEENKCKCTCEECGDECNPYYKRLEQENKELKKQIESQKGLITVGGKQQYEYLQRIDELKKTVENQKLEYEELQCDLSEVENACGCYQSENAELKQENKELKELNKKICEDWEKEIKAYWNTLEEIREIVKADCKGCTAECDCDEDCTRYMIKNKINEVLNEKEL